MQGQSHPITLWWEQRHLCSETCSPPQPRGAPVRGTSCSEKESSARQPVGYLTTHGFVICSLQELRSLWEELAYSPARNYLFRSCFQARKRSL